MPIKIDRILALLSAAEEALLALDSTREIITRESKLFQRGEASAEQALGNIDLMVEPNLLLHDPVKLRTLLQVERAFYTESRLNRNERVKRKSAMRRSKRREGIEE